MTSDLNEIAEVLGIDPAELMKVAGEELAMRRQRDLLVSEPWLFQRDLLCPPAQKGYLRPFHKEGLEWVTRKGGKRLKLILWPRGHLKSTIFTQGETVRNCLKNPNIRVLIKASTTELAETFLSSIKGHFADPRVTEKFGNLLPNNRSGKNFRDNKLELTLLSRTMLHLKEPTITASGLEATKTSQHYDLIFCDDLVVRENVGTFEQMDKVWTIWQDLLDLLEPDGTMVVIGTRWHPLDLYGRIISDYVDPRCFDGSVTNHVANCSCHFDVSCLQLRDENGAYIFDSKFDDVVANQLLQVKGQREFSAQYENNPLAQENLWFNTASVEEATLPRSAIDSIRNRLVWYMMVDPAESTESRSSYTAIVCVGVDHQTGHWYVDYARQCRVDTAGFITEVFAAIQRYQGAALVFGMEKKTRKALEYVLKDKMAQYGTFFSINDLEPMMGNTSDAKGIRIRSLKPLFEHKRIHVAEDLTDLLKILKTIPSATTYDLADALSYCFQLVPKGLGATGTNVQQPAHVLQNKGINYAVGKSSRRRAGTHHRHGLGRFYAPARTLYRSERVGTEPVQATPDSVPQVHGDPLPGNDRQFQKVPEYSRPYQG